MIFRGKEAMLDRKLPHGNLQNLEVSYLFHRWRRFMSVAVPAVFVCCLHVQSFLISSDHSLSQTGSSQRSENSVCNVSFSDGYSCQRSFWRNRTLYYFSSRPSRLKASSSGMRSW